MKLSIFKILKFYFIALAALVVLGILAIVLTIPHKERLQKQILAHPYVQQKLAEGYKPVHDCGNYQRHWNHESSSLCLEREIADSSGSSTLRMREVIVHQTGSKAPPCEYQVLSQTDTLCLP